MTTFAWHAQGLDDIPDHDGWLDPVEHDRFSRMQYPKRRSEALLGRWTAKATVCGALGRPTDHAGLAGVVVRNAPDGAPEVFVDGVHIPWVIAMTDRADWGVSALREGPERIGVDLELVEPRSRAFVEDYFTPAEQRSVATGDADLLANLIWSAKESSLKVLRTGLRRDTRTVEVVLEPGDGGEWVPFTVLVDTGPRHHGHWRRFGEFILTVACEVPAPPPESLIEPSPLESAAPSHRWMGEGPLR